MEAFIQFLNSPGMSTLLLCIIVVEVILVRSIFRKIAIMNMCYYLLDCLAKIYFCGYGLGTIHLTRFFPRYLKSVDWGFCGPVAGMSMLALKNNRTARYVYAEASEHRYEHCWVEFRYRGVWYVIDPCWCNPFMVSRRWYYRNHQPEIIKTCSYDEFWNYKVSQQFYEKMLRPETSWLIGELMDTYGFEEGNARQLFNHRIATMSLDEKSGYHINLRLFYTYPEVIFSRRIMHQMMQKPNRTRPQAHLIRQVRRGQRKVKEVFDEYRRTHPENVKSNTSA